MLKKVFSRRELSRKILLLFGAGSFLKLVNNYKSFGRNRFDLDKTEITKYKLGRIQAFKKLKFFNEYQAATVMALARTIIPTDKDPGAVEVGVVYYIKEFMRRYFGHSITLGAIGEELPNVNNTITIDKKVTDYWGIPVAKIYKEITQNELSMLEAMQKRCLEIVDAARGEVVNQGADIQTGSGHYMGTCRMGNDPSKSVLNSFCQSHDVKNLFCVDGSCFVSGSGASPTLTIQALAYRTADYIIDQAKKLNL